jgi:CRP-like cAMP-binding protein
MSIIDLLPSDAPLTTASPGGVIFSQGEPGKNMYVIAEGKVDIVIDGKLAESVGPDGIIGEMALIDSSPRSASAIAQTRCTLIPLDEQRFMTLIAKQPEFALYVMRALAGRLRHMDTGFNGVERRSGRGDRRAGGG